MKGFLQRMVANVAASEKRVHPVVGGLFTKDPSAAFREVSIGESAVRGDSRVPCKQLFHAFHCGRCPGEPMETALLSLDARGVDLAAAYGYGF